MGRLRLAVTASLAAADGRAAFGHRHLLSLADVATPWFLGRDADTLTADLIGDAAAVLHFSRNRITAPLLSEAPGLALVARLGVGLDDVDLDACTRAGVLVSITPGAVVRPMAFAAVSLLLAVAHAVPAKDELVRSGRWAERLHTLGPGITGGTLGIIGLGRIGREIVRITRGFGLNYLACGPRLTTAQAAADGVRATSLDELLRTADYVCVCCPRTPETEGLIGRRELALLREDAILVNIARGGIVDDAALADALQAGQLAGAGADVFWPEPPPAGHPLLAAPRAILAPHSAGYSRRMLDQLMAEACAAVRAVAADQLPASIANPAAAASAELQHKLAALATDR